ncbi:putative peroxisomal multifunctional beta-oxidation protein [Emiliania huxleyi CCMP1516]|uniref:MaoC-like domain-containing protein n=2 Tax=Emiliania huxleyi TaxID=2903 RepID=A0A0D3J6W6_EMIH1|nr:putative peroxisomal multifunctional beta-oxidation protein [Emiliania huxleyi CCMP1516]EOD19251.1 putative peroxisomal multifunctional beta-oxidation protein [Emiliania huxleyi CCMP1516]|eukprot:XP_005771680.1 putative peroxisomal multifunctional beta-oxidation protein [Emiliania huxleyi CCMP1516]
MVDFPSPTLLRLASSGLALPGARALLDAERYIERVRDVPSAEGAHTLTYQSRLLGVVPKRNGALIHTAGELFDGGGALLYRMRASAYALGATSVAASGCEPSAPPTPPPPRACDASHTECVGAQQARLYRLSGDYNPLHVDPAAARAQGFESPILHGLCTLGYAVRAVLLLCARGDAARFRPHTHTHTHTTPETCTCNAVGLLAVRARFVGTVSPGSSRDVVRTRVWAEGRRVVFVAEAKGGEEQEGASRMVIGNAYVELDRDAELAVPRPVARL